MRTFKYELAASVLLEAILSTDEKACAKYGVTQRTLWNYRQRLAEDSKLSDIFSTKHAAFNAAWAERMPRALVRALQALEKSFTEIAADPRACKNPLVINALANAFHLIADVELSNKVVGNRIRENARSDAENLGAPRYPNGSEYSN